ncbi:unnamed protein product [Ostreobium quekettii]|uniref:Uncharacterized protein n=1 Tax=Ostreobium quekettii TaxID=121088 RepID=A0A8S1JA10_9CHLO|nr:unnamed protein product [Ostreobium quekettii]
MQSECRELEECTWEAGCVVFLEDKIAECNAESGDPPSGSLCDFFVVSSKCQAFAELEKNCTDAGCDWKMDDQNGFCTASQEMILNVELAMAPELIPKISAELKRCNESTTVEECEDSQGAMG